MVKKTFNLDLSENIWKIINTQFKLNGESDEEIFSNIVQNFIAEHGFYPDIYSLIHGHGIKDYIEVQQIMIDSIIELLEKKGLATYLEWGEIMDQKIMEESK